MKKGDIEFSKLVEIILVLIVLVLVFYFFTHLNTLRDIFFSLFP